MIDPKTEKCFSLREAAKLDCLPRRRGGKAPHASTLLRWATAGVKGVTLETIRWGGTLCTSAEALVRFAEALSHPKTAPADTPAQRKKSFERAESLLDRVGI